MGERRELERFNLDTPAKVVVNRGKGEKEVLSLHTRDLSSKGAFIVTDEPVDEGTRLTLEFVLPMEKLMSLIDMKRQVRLEVKGTVVRSTGDGMAVSFIKNYKIESLNNSQRLGGKS